jgi:hypothetical protein
MQQLAALLTVTRRIFFSSSSLTHSLDSTHSLTHSLTDSSLILISFSFLISHFSFHSYCLVLQLCCRAHSLRHCHYHYHYHSHSAHQLRTHSLTHSLTYSHFTLALSHNVLLHSDTPECNASKSMHE